MGPNHFEILTIYAVSDAVSVCIVSGCLFIDLSDHGISIPDNGNRCRPNEAGNQWAGRQRHLPIKMSSCCRNEFST